MDPKESQNVSKARPKPRSVRSRKGQKKSVHDIEVEEYLSLEVVNSTGTYGNSKRTESEIFATINIKQARRVVDLKCKVDTARKVTSSL